MASAPLQYARNADALQHGEERVAAWNVEERQQVVARFQQLSLHIAYTEAAGYTLLGHRHGRKRSRNLTYLHHDRLQTRRAIHQIGNRNSLFGQYQTVVIARKKHPKRQSP